MEKVIVINGGEFWYKNEADNKLRVDKFAIRKFDDLKKVFKFSRENFTLNIANNTLKKIAYNFYINNKKVTKKEVIKFLENNKTII